VTARWTVFPRPSQYLARRALVEGRRSRIWRAVFVAILARRAFHRIMRTEARTVAIERIKPGETIILRGVRSRDLPS
jgi:hypothetical protein